jgi:2-aminoethylphosphonate-pyruvate transaminase
MVHDWGSRDATFLKINTSVLERLVDIVGGRDAGFATVPVQGSGTFAVEAMLTTLVPPDGGCLVLVNGAYGQRAKRILEIARRHVQVHETAEDCPPDLAAVERLLAGDPRLTHVFAVHCETTSGILNPVREIGELARRLGRRFLLDSMSAFGALPLDVSAGFDAVAASSNKCIEGIPGLGFVIASERALAAAKGNATSLTLDLHDQWQNFKRTGQYRFTPPIHVIVSFHQALEEFVAEGGQPGRGGRYVANGRILVEGMKELGFRPLLSQNLQAPIIYTFHMPKNPRFVFQAFYDRLKDRGYVIYPGKLTVADSFRIGCIGRIDGTHMRAFLANVGEVLAEMGIERIEG